MMRLAAWLARRYAAGLGETLDAALPFAVRSGTRRRTIRVVTPSDVQLDEGQMRELEGSNPKQARLLRILLDAGGAVAAQELLSQAKVSDSVLKSVAAKGLVSVEHQRAEVGSKLVRPGPDPEVELNQWQQAALTALLDGIRAGGYHSYLLFGVTGSGKTEVYLRALAEVIASGRQGIVLVPEISLTPQTVARFHARFERIAVLHSHLTDAERHDQWRSIQNGEADVVIGARSAVFAPTPRLGLIVIDEEHEATFKQQNSPRYDAREAARARARFEGATLLLGSATPSLESYHRALSGRLQMLEMPERVGRATFPETIVADLNLTRPAPGRKSFLTDRLRASLHLCVSRGEQAILFLNRRGFATAAICGGCGVAIGCGQCDIVLVFHRRIGRLICHYCGHEQRLPPVCESCSQPFRLAGFGTERVEDEVRRAVPRARVARMDSDTMRERGAHESVLSAFRRGEIDVLVGTQMIAKGLDFPNVTLVGIISADTTLNLPDYRAAERTFSLLAQVAGRAGRSDKSGAVVVQTHRPDHFAIRTALCHDYKRFAAEEIEARRRDGYPPFGHLARVVVEGEDEEEVSADANKLRDALDLRVDARHADLLGPAPAPISMIAARHRYHLVIKTPYRMYLRRFVVEVRDLPRAKEGVRRLLDVDPLTML